MVLCSYKNYACVIAPVIVAEEYLIGTPLCISHSGTALYETYVVGVKKDRVPKIERPSAH